MVTLKSGNITLDKIKLEDANDYYLIASNPNITTSFMLDEVENIVEAKSVIEEIINNYSDSEFYYFAIRLDNKLIGVLKSYESDYLELGYAINEDYWNKGYATIALNLTTNYFLKIDRIKKIILGAFSDNYPSIRVMEKCGYSFIGIKKDEFFYKGKSRDIAYFMKEK
ncbi:MAG: GNAT family N-acetyltransferase [Acholeplasmatales bacterium]|nr:GNAT family N-acetyltransferase [Acholeplasmatales bacterium]